MVFGRRSSYRLGRRLKSSAKARLDYITYLQTGADNGNGGDIPPGQMKATISAGGLLTADLLAGIGLSAVISGDGLLSAHMGVLRSMAATIDAGGEIVGNVAITQKLAGTIDGGGEMFAHLFPPHRVEGTIDGGGEITAKVLVTARLTGAIGAGGMLDADIFYQIGLSGTIDAGGEVSANLTNTRPAINLAGTIAGGGELTADIADTSVVNLSATIGGGGLVEGNVTNLDASAQAIINAMVPTPTLERQTAINTLVKALKVNPAYWNGLGGLYLFKAHSEQAAKINWKSPGTFNCVNIGTMEFVADDYIKANANSCLNTQYNPGTGPVTPFTLTTASLMVIADDTTKSDVLDAGSVGSSSVFVNANAVAATNNLRGCLSNTTTMTATITAVNGYEMYGVSRTTSGASMLLKQGVTTIATVAQDATALPSSRIAFCGTLNNSVATASPRRQRAGAWGQGLTNTGWTTITNAIKAYLDSIKTPVYMSATMTAGGLLEGNIAPQNVAGATALIVAGGGGGGSGGDGTGANYSHAGGGGGGGVISVAPFTLAPGTYPVVVGSGGARGTGATAGANGGNSSFNGQTAVGGGRGAQYNAAANSGGSGGGGKGATTTWPSNTGGGAGTGGQGNTGGAGATGVYGASGGGGGATGAGGEAGFGNQAARGAAGPGLTSSISGTSRVYGQGGLGATADTGAGTSGLPNSGFGGGGGSASAWNQGGVGGSGVVVIRYPGAARGTGGTITTVGSDTVHTFTASGNLVIT